MEIYNKEVQIKNIAEQSVNFAFALGGYAAGKILGKFYDKIIGEQLIAGLGADPNSMGVKLGKGIAIMTASAVGNYVIKDKKAKSFTTGCGLAGAEEIYVVITGKKLSGFGDGILGEQISLSNDFTIPRNVPQLQLSENINLDLPDIEEPVEFSGNENRLTENYEGEFDDELDDFGKIDEFEDLDDEEDDDFDDE